MDYSDEELARLTVGDKKYFDPLVSKYAQKIRAYIARLTGNWPDSEDVTQEAFIKAYVNIASFNPKLKFSSWLYRIAHNEAVNYIKKHYRHRQVEFSDEIKNKLIDNGPTLGKILEKENAKMVRDGLLQLKPREREILELAYFEEKSYLEIADILEMSVNSVGSTIKRSRDKLKKILQINDKPRR